MVLAVCARFVPTIVGIVFAGGCKFHASLIFFIIGIGIAGDASFMPASLAWFLLQYF
tara:strand:+ start:348 stop:518 length:171 start_codon:yes stop_codon:yes gene_type:complete